MKERFIYEALILLLYVAYAIAWLGRVFDKWVAQCRPHERFGTHVWHEHRFLRWRWLGCHSEKLAGRQMIAGNEERLRASGEHIHMRVYPAGSRLSDE